ncbi:MAG: hypothetical protein ACRBI6_01895, partial [Acidimicrobiales bacterium]
MDPTTSVPETTTSTAPSTTEREDEVVEAAPLPEGWRLLSHGTGELSAALPAEWFAFGRYAAGMGSGGYLGGGASIYAYDPGDNFVTKVLDPYASDRILIWVPASVDPGAPTDPALALDADGAEPDCDAPVREPFAAGELRGMRDRYANCGGTDAQRWHVALVLPTGDVVRAASSVTGDEGAAEEVLGTSMSTLELTAAPPIEPVDPAECVPSQITGSQPEGFSITNVSEEPLQIVAFDPSCASDEV